MFAMSFYLSWVNLSFTPSYHFLLCIDFKNWGTPQFVKVRLITLHGWRELDVKGLKESSAPSVEMQAAFQGILF